MSPEECESKSQFLVFTYFLAFFLALLATLVADPVVKVDFGQSHHPNILVLSREIFGGAPREGRSAQGVQAAMSSFPLALGGGGCGAGHRFNHKYIDENFGQETPPANGPFARTETASVRSVVLCDAQRIPNEAG